MIGINGLHLLKMDPIDIVQNAGEIGTQIEVQREFSIVFWILILFNLLAIAITRTRNAEHFRFLFITAIFNRQLQQNTQEHLRLNEIGPILLNIAYINCLSIIAFDLISSPNQWFTLLFVTILSVAALIKLGTINFIGFVAKSNRGTYEHTLNHFIFFQLGAIILTPILIFTHFLSDQMGEVVGFILLGIIALLIFIRELQSFVRAFRSGVSTLYIILYLCTLELLPLVLIIKVFVSNYQGLT